MPDRIVTGMTPTQKVVLSICAIAAVVFVLGVVPLLTEDAPTRAQFDQVIKVETSNQRLLEGLEARSKSRTQTFDEIQNAQQTILRYLLELKSERGT